MCIHNVHNALIPNKYEYALSTLEYSKRTLSTLSTSYAICSWVSAGTCIFLYVHTSSAGTTSRVESRRHSAPAVLYSCVCERGNEAFQIKLL